MVIDLATEIAILGPAYCYDFEPFGGEDVLVLH